MEHNLHVWYKNMLLRPLRQDDLEPLRKWRNDASNSKYLRKLDIITPEMQIEWFKSDLINTDCFTFAIEETETIKRIIGSISLYNFSGKTAEYGRIMVGESETRGKGNGFFALVMCLHLGFVKFKLEAITASVHENNISACRMNEKVGFSVVGCHPFVNTGGHELEIVINKDDFNKKHAFLSEVVIGI